MDCTSLIGELYILRSLICVPHYFGIALETCLMKRSLKLGAAASDGQICVGVL